MVVITNEEIFLSNDWIIGTNNNIVVLGELSADIIEVDFCEFSSNIVGVFVLELGAKSWVEVWFEVVHGEESFE